MIGLPASQPFFSQPASQPASMLLVGMALYLQASMLLLLRPHASTTTRSSFMLARQYHHHLLRQPRRYFAGRSSADDTTNNSTIKSNNLISSPQSNTIKRIQALLSKRKKRNGWQQVVVEGPRMVLDLYANPRTRSLIRKVVISEDKWDTLAPQLDNVRLLPATAEVLQSCTDTVTNQGIVAVCDIPKYDDNQRDRNTSHHHFDRRRPLILILDGVSDPGNLGTLLRSALATGVASVVLLPDSCDPWNPKAVRSAMGATFLLDLQRAASWTECLQQMQYLCGSSDSNGKSIQIYAATMLEEEERDDDDDNTDPEEFPSSSSTTTTATTGIAHYDVDWASSSSSSFEPVALVIGSEGSGLTPPLRQAVQRGDITTVHVPMEPGIESLNAAVCGSVILFEYYRQVREAARARRRRNQT